MARFAFAIVLAAVLLMAAGRLTHAGPSTAEVFWRAVLPGSAVPDTVLRFLRPATTTSPTIKRPAASQGLPASGGARGGPFGYDSDNYEGPSELSSATPRGDRTEARVTGRSGATDDDFDYNYEAPSERSSATPRGDRSSEARVTGSSGTRDDDFDYGYEAAPSEHSHRAATPTAPTAVFFHEEAVRVGSRLPLHFRAAEPAAVGLLPRHVADSIPFTTAALPTILALFGVPPGSSMAAAMVDTLRTCEQPPPVAGEVRFCATSLEAMVERAVAALGTRDVRAVTSALPRAGLPPQAFAVRAVRRVASGGGGGSFVACHDEAYPYTVYRCHDTGPARAYLVEMEAARGGGGAVVTVAFICHTDTARWNPEHVSFKVLGTKPGGKPVCHLMPYGHIVWAKNVK